MNIAPVSPTDSEILVTIQDHWNLAIDSVAYFPAGFGAHHWQGCFRGEPVAFITLDQPGSLETQADLQQAYAAAHRLFESGLEFVVPPVPSLDGRFTVTIPEGTVSLTPWVNGITPSPEEAAVQTHLEQTTNALMQLHAYRETVALPAWLPCVTRELPDRLEQMMSTPWERGPLGEQARELVLANIASIRTMLVRYLELAAMASANAHSWVPTHGEPHFANQIVSGGSLKFVDWESLRLAPKERDVVGIPTAAWPMFQPDPAMIELFQLEWTLSEIEEYAHWFSVEHTGDADDLLALEKLRSELSRN